MQLLTTNQDIKSGYHLHSTFARLDYGTIFFSFKRAEYVLFTD